MVRRRWSSGRESGQVLILFALFSVVLVGAMALAADAGFLLVKRREVQGAADAAAVAAARAALDGASGGVMTDTANVYVDLNAELDNGQVTVSNPPASGRYAGNADYVQVTVTTEVPKFFLGVLYTGDWEVQASAVAGIQTEGYSTGLLALNSGAGGIRTSGGTTITVNNASIVSNYNIRTTGNTTLTASEYIVANDGFNTSGSTTFTAGKGTNPSAPEIPDPLADLIDPPTLPPFPGNTVPTASGSNQSCYSKPGWWPPPGAADFLGTPGTYSNCTISIAGNGEPTPYVFPTGQYRFTNGARITTNYHTVRIAGGIWNFSGNNGGISVGGSTPNFEMGQGRYSFTNRATLSIGGNAPNNNLGSGGTTPSSSTFYFDSTASLEAGGSNNVTIYPGTYIFDGGTGLSMSGDNSLTFQPGTYEFWFNNGADMSFSGSSRIVTVGNVYVKMYFYGTSSNPSNLQMSGNTSFNIPPGEYYFDRGQMRNTGSTLISGDSVFLYFTNGGYLHSTGSAGFQFTAPTTTIYPGYYPGVYIYSDRSNTATFQWHGTTNSNSRGIIYLPSSRLTMGGASNAKVWTGQLIVDSLETSGNTSFTVNYEEYVATEIPMVYLVE
jgi:hypothetical protein